MAPTAPLVSTLAALLLLPAVAQDLFVNKSAPAHSGGDQGVGALPQRVNVSSGGDKGAIALGSCSYTDKRKIMARGGGNSPSGFPKLVYNCVLAARSWFSWSGSAFTSCMMSNAGLSGSCAGCFVGGAQFAWNNCKFTCLANWCGSGCLSCIAPAEAPTDGCAGFTVPRATPCR